MRVLLIAGGWSNEREVSLSGAAKIRTALESLGHECLPYDPSDDLRGLMAAARQADFAFLNLHGSPGEDGLIQAMLDLAGCPYQGSGPAGSLLALDKSCSKSVFQEIGLATPAWEFLAAPPEKGWATSLSFPLFAKPNAGGSSIDIRKVEEPEDLNAAIRQVWESRQEVLLEEAVAGDEITCGVLGDEPLPCILIRPKKSGVLFDYSSKYEDGGADEICPAPIAPDLESKIRIAALAAHRALGLTGYSRADFMVREGVPFILEVNTLPGMTPTSLVPRAAAVAGYDFPALVGRLIELGLERFGQPHGDRA